MRITVEIPDEYLAHTSEEELKRLAAIEIDRALVRQRFGDDIADAGVTMAEILEGKKRAFQGFKNKYPEFFHD